MLDTCLRNTELLELQGKSTIKANREVSERVKEYRYDVKI
jgi:hypothetical protein